MTLGIFMPRPQSQAGTVYSLSAEFWGTEDPKQLNDMRTSLSIPFFK
jgi:hypothetical protein